MASGSNYNPKSPPMNIVSQLVPFGGRVEFSISLAILVLIFFRNYVFVLHQAICSAQLFTPLPLKGGLLIPAVR